ncbi:PAS domain S-box protein [Noviherbaspirillum galbum]|uniref:histidine kinase n=1 Tax=Noviherbaspirillum galbum TaxID=2709383 RepID=A0A6B3SU09_9BURK|nr:PAS domain S-box protein [Noviherbaspirillum galbum]NEX63948.1 PAS domain S-box protein [Noviherbaspirillum galbum]
MMVPIPGGPPAADKPDAVKADADKPDADSRFRTLFEQAPFSVQLLALNGRTLQVNRAWERMWGNQQVPSIKDYVLHGDYNMLADPQLEAKGILPILRRAFAGESVTLPTIVYDPAELGMPGPPRWVRATAHPIKDTSGEVQEVMLVHDDVTEQVMAEQAMLASESRLKQLANTIPQLAWMADSTGWIHWYNDRWYAYTGTTPDQMEGWGWQQVHDPAALPRILDKWKQHLASGAPFEMTFPLRGHDGLYRPFYTLVAPLKDERGQVTQWFGTNTDVSSLQAAERALRLSEEKLLEGLDAGRMVVWEWDLRSDDIDYSPNAASILGYTAGNFHEQSRHFHPEDAPLLLDAIHQARETRGQFRILNRRIRPDNGALIWLETLGKVICDEQGQPVAIRGLNIDVTERVKAESEIKEASRRKDEFLAMLAHELRNPLAPIAMATQLMRMQQLDGARKEQAVDIIDRQVKHMTELVDDLLDVSRVTRGLVELDRDTVDLKAVVAHAVEQVRPLIDSRHHALTVRMLGENVHVHGDHTRLVQVIVNLLSNAAKYTPQHGEINLQVDVSESQARIRVTDNGCGIDAALMPYLFDLFTQAERTPDRSQGGLGIGLALVKSMVQLHGGQVKAESAGRNRGSTFIVLLPLIPVEPPADRNDLPMTPDAGERLRILIVDDNRDAGESLGTLLSALGHDVKVCEDGASALALAGSHRPRLCILDIGLPDMTGYELASRLRKNAALPGMECVALTGYGQSHDRALTKAAGFRHHFVKPVDVQQLMKVILDIASSESTDAD